MTRSGHLEAGALGAVYLLWLAAWVIIGDQPFGPGRNHWDQAAAALATSALAVYASRRTPRPYRGFLVMQSLAFLMLAGSWATYQVSGGAAAVATPVQGAASDLADLTSDAFYAGCVFALLIAWGYLALERWQRQPLSRLTATVFAVLTAGMGAVFASFYVQQYGHYLDTLLGRFDAVTAAFEFAVLATGLLCMLLKAPPVAVWMLVGTAILMAGDMAYSLDTVPRAIEAVWMLGQFVLLTTVVRMRDVDMLRMAGTGAAGEAPEMAARSGLSGILILLSLGALLLAPVLWFLPVAAVWKSFFSVLFILALVTVLVWITDRFDDTVAFLRGYVSRVHRSRLASDEWRSTDPGIGAALRSTGLDVFLDEFRQSAARLKQDILFLGPERLYGTPKELSESRKPSCFIVMPFRQEWSADVHRILAGACEAAGVRPVRGDDLFTPTDILEDIWQSINAADFVIADITGRNANVMYELGIAHTLAKPVLILSRDAADIPIDLATRRVILYGQQADLWRDDLARLMTEAIAKVVADYALHSHPR
jgi:hypothetical protein